MQCFRQRKSAVVLHAEGICVLFQSYSPGVFTGSAAAGGQCLSGVGSTSVTTVFSALMRMAAWSHHHLPVALSFHVSNQGHGQNTHKGRNPDWCRVCFQVLYSISGSAAHTYTDIQLSTAQRHQNNLGHLADEVLSS